MTTMASKKTLMADRTPRGKSQEQEHRIAKMRGVTPTRGSGNQWANPQDVSEERYLWEMKRTDNTKSIRLQLSDLKQLRDNAVMRGKMPVLHCEIGDQAFVVLTEDDFMMLIEERERRGDDS